MSVFPKALYGLSSRSYGGALKFLKGLNPQLAQHQRREKGISKPDAHALKNTDDLYDLIGRPLDVIPTIHIAGTNGKGSTSYKLAEGLKYSGLRTGLCTGPHISSFRERMQVDGELVSEDDVVQLLETVLELCVKHEIPATFFEIAFIMTCLHFQSMRCDVVVMEVGMGGRFDASNVIASYLSVVTSIGMDHANSLGGTLEMIAHHKAGIFKPDTNSLVGPGCPIHVMEEEATKVGATLHNLYSYLHHCCAQNWLPPLGSHPIVHFPVADHVDSLSTDFDPDLLCSQLAVSCLSLLNHPPLSSSAYMTQQPLFASIDTKDAGLLNHVLHSRLPCRFEEVCVMRELTRSVASTGLANSTRLSFSSPDDIVSKVKIKVILDVAHNIPALSALMEKLERMFGSNIRVIMGMSRGKGTSECLDIIKRYVPKEKVDFIQSDNHRAISPEELYEAIGNSGGKKVLKDSDEDRKEEDHIFNMVNGKITASRYRETNHTIQCVLNEIIRDAFPKQEFVVGDMSDKIETQFSLADDACSGPNTGICSEVLVVCGTLYAMPLVRRSLGIMEPNDAFEVDVTI